MPSMLRLLSAAGAAFLLTGTLGRAALPQSAYDERRRNARVIAVVQVLRVAVGKPRGNARRGWFRSVEVTARVIRVERGIGLSAPQEIVIRYQNFQPPTEIGWAGAAPTPVLKLGRRVRAWLNPASRIGWRPAAGAESFEKMR